MTHKTPRTPQDTFHQLVDARGQILAPGSAVTVAGRETYVIGFQADGRVFVRAADGRGFETVTPESIGATIIAEAGR